MADSTEHWNPGAIFYSYLIQKSPFLWLNCVRLPSSTENKNVRKLWAFFISLFCRLEELVLRQGGGDGVIMNWERQLVMLDNFLPQKKVNSCQPTNRLESGTEKNDNNIYYHHLTFHDDITHTLSMSWFVPSLYKVCTVVDSLQGWSWWLHATWKKYNELNISIIFILHICICTHTN